MRSPTVQCQSYGKSLVRLSRVARDGPCHEFIDLTVSIALEGDFNAAYAAGDCSLIVATDTMKNAVYALASQHGVQSIEGFSQLLARHFLAKYSHVNKASVVCEQRPWTRMDLAGRRHNHAFLGSSTERSRCEFVMRADGSEALSSGLAGLQALKTAGSGFSGFLRDEYTTLPETDDRVFATTIQASWPCPEVSADWTKWRQVVRDAFLDVFANLFSKSAQHTLYEMARAALVACPLIDEISIRLPNQHHLLANLEPFGLKNPNEVFVPTSEPFGDIGATIRRGGSDEPGSSQAEIQE